jgi:2-polyprenyl-3-methyl-5-hydroxy-6-metoxy-1,4-benzoquinol methylase
MTTVPDRTTFEAMCAGQGPWDIGRPQKPFPDVADRITGTLLDAACGTGDTALYFAGRGCQVTGIDFIEEASGRGGSQPTRACPRPSWSWTP